MFEGLLEKILQSKLGLYIDGIDRKNLSMGVWSGNILIENASLKAKAFDRFKLPFHIKFSKISKLKATVPWMSLSSSPVEIILDTLMIVLVPKPKQEWEINDLIGKNFKRELINEFAVGLLESLRKGETDEDRSYSPGYLEKLSMRILDNIQLKIRNIHVRYEVDLSSGQKAHDGFSLGVRLEQLNIVTTNEQWEIQFLDRTKDDNADKPMHKLLALTDLAIYSDSSENCFFSQVYQTEEEMIDAFKTTSVEGNESYNYILKPISINAKLKMSDTFNHDVPKYWVQLIVDEFTLNLKKKELLNLIKIMEYITAYQKFQDSYNQTLKYKFLRPAYSILEEEKDEKCTEFNVNPNARMWWKYAIECVVRTIKMKNGAPNQFKLSKVAQDAIGKQYRHYYSKIFSKKEENQQKSGGNADDNLDGSENVTPTLRELSLIEQKALDKTEQHHYYYILTALDSETLKQWTSQVVKKHQANFAITESKKTQSNGIWGMLSWATGNAEAEGDPTAEQADPESNADFEISEEEFKQIDSLVQNSIQEENTEDINDSNLLIHIEYKCIRGEINVEDDCESEKNGILFKYNKC